MLNLKWAEANIPSGISFNDIPVGETFKNIRGRGAIYRKVLLRENHQDRVYMEELKTAKLFPPTTSPIQLVEVNMEIFAKKPKIRGY